MLRLSGEISIRFMGAAVHVLVANEWASYRESLAAVLRASLPDVEVSESTSAELNREVLRLRPDLVVCSRVTSLVDERVANWVELHPDCGTFSTFCLDGRRSSKDQVDLNDLLSAVEEIRPATRTA